MDFGETLLAAQKNQQHKTSDNVYYRAKFEPPKKEQKPAARLSANIQKFLAKKEEEERRKQDETKRKRDELLAMRDPKATRKIQKMLKVIKSANKSVLEEATDHEHTAVTRGGAEQPDQDDYGYESQEAAALYSKMMEKYSKMPEEEKFPAGRGKVVKKDLEGTRERMRAALQRGEEPQPRQRKSKSHPATERALERDDSPSPPPPPEKKIDKHKIRKAAPPPLDFNQLLKLAEQKKDEPVVVAPPVKRQTEAEPERPMTKRQKKEFEEEQARREARRRRMLEAEARGSGTGSKPERQMEKENKKSESTFTRIPKLSDKNTSLNKSTQQSSVPMKRPIKEEPRNKEKDKFGSSHSLKQDLRKLEQNKSIDLKSHNTFRIERSASDRQSIKLSRDEDRVKINRDNEKGKSFRPQGRDRFNRDDERGRTNRPDDRSRVNRVDERGRMNRPDETSRLNQEKVRNIRELDKDRTADTTKPSRPQDRVRKENLNANGTANSFQNKPPQKQPSQDKFRKPELKDKLIAKERMLFGNGRDSPKPSSASRPDSSKHPRPNEQRPKEGPSKLSKPAPNDRRMAISSSNTKPNQATSKLPSKSFDFDKHVSSLRAGGPERPAGARTKLLPSASQNRKPLPKRRAVDSDSEYDSELDDFIDDGDDAADYSHHIKEIFGYDKSRYRDMDDDDHAMESSFAQQMREEYVSKKIGIMEDLEDMRLEALEKKNAKKRRRISDDDDD